MSSIFVFSNIHTISSISSNDSGGVIIACVFMMYWEMKSILVNEEKHPGTYEIEFNAAGLGRDIYKKYFL